MVLRKVLRLRSGFTLVELMIVMTILVLVALIMVGILNPTALVDRGYDARKKKDIKRIGVSFEEYFNDKGCYPVGYDFDNMVCGSTGFAPWLASWPCEPNGNHYKFVFSDSVCPKWYKIYTKLGNDKDVEIPPGWYQQKNYFFGDGTLTPDMYNFGTSSTNVNWFDRMYDSICTIYPENHLNDQCNAHISDTQCNRKLEGCSGQNCYANGNCDPKCQVDCCGAGCK